MRSCALNEPERSPDHSLDDTILSRRSSIDTSISLLEHFEHLMSAATCRSRVRMPHKCFALNIGIRPSDVHLSHLISSPAASSISPRRGPGWADRVLTMPRRTPNELPSPYHCEPKRFVAILFLTATSVGG